MAQNAGGDANINIGVEIGQVVQDALANMQNALAGLTGQQDAFSDAARATRNIARDMNIDFAKAAENRASQMNEGVESTLEMQRAQKDLSKLTSVTADEFASAWHTVAEQVDAIQTGTEAGLTKALASGELVRYRRQLAEVQEQMAKGMEDLSKLFEDPVSMLDDMADGTIRLENMSGEQLKQIEKQHDMLKKIQKIDEAKLKTEDKLLDGYEEQVKQLEILGKQAKRLNVLGEIDLKNANRRLSIGKDLEKAGLGKLGNYIKSTTLASVVTQGLEKAFNGLLDSQEKFALTSNRATGSINELTQASATLHGQLGITSKEADAAVHSLSQMAVPLDDMKELVVTNAAMAAATGASNEAIGKLQRRMMVFGMTAGEVNSHMDMMASTARDFGLTGSEMNEVMSISEDAMIKLAGSTGKTGKELAKLTKQFVQLAGMAKKAGVDVGETLRGAANAAENPLDQIALLGSRFGEWQRALSEGRGEDAQRIRMEAIAERADQIGGNFMTATVLAGNFGTSTKEMANSKKIVDAYADSTDELNKKMQGEALKAFAERMTTIRKQVSILIETGVAFLKMVLMPFIVMAGVLLSILTPMAQALGWFIGKVQQLQDWLGKSHWTLKLVIGGLLFLTKAFIGLMIILKITGHLKGWRNIVRDTLRHVRGFVKGILSGVVAMGKWIVMKWKGIAVEKASQTAATASAATDAGMVKGAKDKLAAAKDWFKGLSKGKETQDAVTKGTAAMSAGQKAAGATSAASSAQMAGGAKVLDKGLSWGLIAKLAVLVVIFIALIAVIAWLDPAPELLYAIGVSMILFAAGVWLLSTALVALTAVGAVAIPILIVLALAILVMGVGVLLAGIGLKMMGEGAAIGGVALFYLALAMVIVVAATWAFIAAVWFLGFAGTSLILFSGSLVISALALMFFSWAIGNALKPIEAIGEAAASMAGFDHFSRFVTDVDAISTDKLESVAASIAAIGMGLEGIDNLGVVGAIMKHIASVDNSKEMSQKEKAWRDEMKTKAETSNTHLATIVSNTGAMDFSELVNSIRLLISKLGESAEEQNSSLSSTGEMGGGW